MRQLARAARPLVQRLREQRGGHYRINHVKRFLDAVDLPPAHRWQRYQALFSPAGATRAVPAGDRQGDRFRCRRRGSARQYFDGCGATDPLDRALYQDLKMYLPDDILALTDRVGMWHSLELRVPFVDHTLVEFCARTPCVDEAPRGAEEVPAPRGRAALFSRRRSSIIASRVSPRPWPMWLRGPMRAFAESSLSPAAIGGAGILVPDEVTTRLEEHQARRRLNDKQIFALLMFQRWWTRRAQG